MPTSARCNAPNRFDRWAIRVADLMTRHPLSVRADATIRQAIGLLAAKRTIVAPVINEAGRPIGVITLSDLVSGIRDYGTDDGMLFEMQTCELMTPFVFVVDMDTSVHVVFREMLDCRINQMYVADKQGVLIGVLGAAELLDDFNRRAASRDQESCTIAA